VREAVVPVFGERLPGVTYVVRPSAYCIIENRQGEIAAALTPSGLILPGVASRPARPPRRPSSASRARSAGSSCGRPARSRGPPNSSIRRRSGPTTRKPSVFLRALLEGETAAVEEDHELLWLRPEAAAPRMYHESHGWVLGEYQENLVAADPNEFLPKERVP